MTLVLNSGLNLQSPTANDPLLDLNTQPSLDLQFATSKTLDDRVSGNNLITFSRASSGTYVDSDGLIKTAATDAPRFDHDPVTGESLGLLIEEASTNLLTYSEEFNQWTVAHNSTVTSNAATAPDGTLTADRVFFPTTGNTNIYQAITLTQGQQYTFSVYAKAVTPGTNHQFIPYINSPNPKFPPTSFASTSEWKRFTFTFTHTNRTASTYVFILNRGDFYTTDVYFWGAQVEAVSFPTSYIPTSNSAVNRASEVASIEGANFSSWFNQSEGTWFIEAKSDDGNNGVFSVGSLTSPIGGLSYDFGGFNAQWQGSVMDGGFNPVDNLFHKFAFTATETSNTLVTDGTQNDTGTATNSLVATDLGIGVRDAYGPGFGSTYLNGYIARLAYYPYRLTDTTLQEITS